MPSQFKIEAKDETGMFNDLVTNRFDTVEEAKAEVKNWEFPGSLIHILDVENQIVVWSNSDIWGEE